jgi:hypothetical protein
MEITVQVFCVVNKKIDHQQYETNHKKQKKGYDQLYYDRKPDRLMVESRL